MNMSTTIKLSIPIKQYKSIIETLREKAYDSEKRPGLETLFIESEEHPHTKVWFRTNYKGKGRYLNIEYYGDKYPEWIPKKEDGTLFTTM